VKGVTFDGFVAVVVEGVALMVIAGSCVQESVGLSAHQ
jgi:hypothetical protein